MTDTLHIIPHPDEERPLAQLRSEFRATNQQRIHSQLHSHPTGLGVLGDPALARDRYDAEGWAKEMLRRLDESVAQDFGLPSERGEIGAVLGIKLEHLAQDAMLHESVTWAEGTEGTVDHDAPPCDIAAMSDDQLCDYVDAAIKESDRG